MGKSFCAIECTNTLNKKHIEGNERKLIQVYYKVLVKEVKQRLIFSIEREKPLSPPPPPENIKGILACDLYCELNH